MTVTTPEDHRLYRISDVIEQRLIPLSRARIYQLIKAGRLRTVKEGRSTLISTTAIRDYIALLEKEAQENSR